MIQDGRGADSPARGIPEATEKEDAMVMAVDNGSTGERRRSAGASLYWGAVGVVSVITMGGIVALTATQVVSRYVFESSLFWPDEAARFLLILQTFLLAGASFEKGEMVGVTVFTDRLGRVPALACAVVADLFAIALLLLLAWYGWEFAEMNSMQTAAALQIPVSWVYLSVPVGLLILMAHMTAALVRHLRQLFGGEPRP